LLLQHHGTSNTRETGHFLLANVYTCLSSHDFERAPLLSLKFLLDFFLGRVLVLSPQIILSGTGSDHIIRLRGSVPSNSILQIAPIVRTLGFAKGCASDFHGGQSGFPANRLVPANRHGIMTLQVMIDFLKRGISRIIVYEYARVPGTIKLGRTTMETLAGFVKQHISWG
jgi:hypothetical protein